MTSLLYLMIKSIDNYKHSLLISKKYAIESQGRLTKDFLGILNPDLASCLLNEVNDNFNSDIIKLTAKLSEKEEQFNKLSINYKFLVEYTRTYEEIYNYWSKFIWCGYCTARVGKHKLSKLIENSPVDDNTVHIKSCKKDQIKSNYINTNNCYKKENNHLTINFNISKDKNKLKTNIKKDKKKIRTLSNHKDSSESVLSRSNVKHLNFEEESHQTLIANKHNTDKKINKNIPVLDLMQMSNHETDYFQNVAFGKKSVVKRETKFKNEHGVDMRMDYKLKMIKTYPIDEISEQTN